MWRAGWAGLPVRDHWPTSRRASSPRHDRPARDDSKGCLPRARLFMILAKIFDNIKKQRSIFMSGIQSRLNAISAVTNYMPKTTPLNFAETKPTDLFGCNVFNDKVMKERLPGDAYNGIWDR
jgi:hypothetical protein